MDISKLKQKSEFEWMIEPQGQMRVPAILFANQALIEAMDEKVAEQISNVACLPGIVQNAYTMPDAHWGYGFPIGGVAAFNPEAGGVVSAGGVGFDISCGVRSLISGLKKQDIQKLKTQIAEALYQAVPAGVGGNSKITLNEIEMDHMLKGGAKWAVQNGYGNREDLEFIEDQGCAENAKPEYVSERAKQRQKEEMGTLGSGNHYLEVQVVSEIFDANAASAFRIEQDDIIISIHCGSRGLGHQIGTDYLREMAIQAPQFGLILPDRELASAPLNSELGQHYLGAMRAGINCALANRQIITHWVRQAWEKIFPGTAPLRLLYDVSHNTCKEEIFEVDGKQQNLFVHRKGATRALGPHHPGLPLAYEKAGQPVLIGGSMGTASYILTGTEKNKALSFSSSCHGAGRAMSRHQASKHWQGRQLIETLAKQEIIIKSDSYRGVAEEAPLAYKDVNEVVKVAEKSGISKKVAKLLPLICIKG